MQIDLRTVAIKPLRHTFDHLVERFGDKPASRYQEGSYNIQQESIFHYRPSWDAERVLFDKKRTKIQMQDWYALKDPRQYYYGAYTIARARQQDAAESSFDMIEERGLAELIPAELKQIALDVLVPMRHVEWGGNMGNSYITAYGYGTVITQPCLYHAMDHLGVAQYLTRIGLVLDGPEALDAAKEAWMSATAWQPMRRHVENLLVLEDWFEIFVAQNLVLEGLLNPMLYDYLDAEFSAKGGTAISMMTRFMAEWSAETAKWIDAQIKTAAAESPENKAQLSAWVRHYRSATREALAPIAQRAFGDKADEVLADLASEFNARCAKLGLAV
ncbi:aromatic/alkene monooxygenase hydroxylase subunit beta [uncultured Dechloromonas sp.]|uniref:aromatic/alkene monooxygenase hydroxylase subunit beta n=1 Tax=uncultured Dechloromonas sp. TaxID=171719 RepID=UPI0025DE6FFE|nr:aromatic/alkene monooxygenase hydroxylase subunit beta [uncultured Dechloromonas sp.]